MIKKKRTLFNRNSKLVDVPQEWLRWIEPKIKIGAFAPCWIWIGAMERNGYPIMNVDGSVVMVARYVASMFWDFPKSAYVVHSCRARNCVNPNHLVPQKEHPRTKK